MRDKLDLGPCPIEQVIKDTESYLSGIGHMETILSRYRIVWRNFNEYARMNAAKTLTEELCENFVRDKCGFEMNSVGLNVSQLAVRRPILALLEYQQCGSVSRVYPTGDIPDTELPSEFCNSVEKYLEDLKIQNLKSVTIEQKRYFLRRFTKYLVRNGLKSLGDVTVSVINEYTISLTGFARGYIYSMLGTIRQWIRYAFNLGEITTDITRFFPVVTVPANLDVPTSYSTDEIHSLLKSVERSVPIGKRAYAMLMLGVHYGLRSSDIRELRIGNLYFEEKKISIIQRKTGKRIDFDMLPDIGWALIDYLKNGRPQVKSDYVFLSHKAPFAPLTKNNHLWYIVDKQMRLAEIKKLDSRSAAGFHALRHSLAGNLLKQEVSLMVIKQVLDHKNLNTTAAYTKIDIPQLRLCALEVPI